MKNLLKILSIFILSISLLSPVSAGLIEIEDVNPGINISDCGGECDDLLDGTKLVKDQITDLETERSFSDYIQDILVYLLGFISLIAIIYIIYAGFMVLIGAGDEDKLSNSKKTILYVVIGMALIWLAYPITMFIINVLNVGGGTGS